MLYLGPERHLTAGGRCERTFRALQVPNARTAAAFICSAAAASTRCLCKLGRNTPDNIFKTDWRQLQAALKRQPTQQMSFSILNLQSLVNSPHGQFVVSSWRGGESRHLLRNHMSANFSQLEEMAREGITVRVAGTDTAEHFNVVVMYVSDFSHTKEVLGRVQVTAEQGCALCDLPASTWQKPQESEDVRSLGKPRDFQVLASIGRQAEETIGLDPDKDSAAYRDWHKKHDGQTGPPLVNCLCPETCAPCTLHLHLALHRCLWKKISVVVKGRDQEDLLPEALKSIGCTYLAYQVAQYFKNKKKL